MRIIVLNQDSTGGLQVLPLHLSRRSLLMQFTVLNQDSTGGLQVLGKGVGEAESDWIDVPYVEGAFVVNLGKNLSLFLSFSLSLFLSFSLSLFLSFFLYFFLSSLHLFIS
jgi:isopenicillin N synthase-like dioxygenase